MGKIKVLSPLIANQIAAGEVVERPSSVLKELLENSLDANSSLIEVELEKGGMQKILVRDNGKGIAKVDLPNALARHATSKIITQKDLFNINSLGFRGEALASIAAVSQVMITSRLADCIDAWQIRCDSTCIDPEIAPASHPVGTCVEAYDLFYKIPARRKFLKSERTEYLHCEEVFKRLALSNLNAGFSLRHNQKIRLSAYGAY